VDCRCPPPPPPGWHLYPRCLLGFAPGCTKRRVQCVHTLSACKLRPRDGASPASRYCSRGVVPDWNPSSSSSSSSSSSAAASSTLHPLYSISTPLYSSHSTLTPWMAVRHMGHCGGQAGSRSFSVDISRRMGGADECALPACVPTLSPSAPKHTRAPHRSPRARWRSSPRTARGGRTAAA
jgi:hypothetical protein